MGMLALGLGAIGVAAVKMAGDWQSGITSLATGAGELQSNLAGDSAGMLKMATDTGTSTSQLVAGMFMINSAGQKGSAALITLQDAAEGAKVGNADLGVVANGVTTIMTDYASKNETAAQATNDLIATVANGKTHMQDLAQAMATILPTASAAKVSLYDVSGAMATMTGEGVPAADAATYLRQMIMSMDNPSKSAAAALKSIGLTSAQVSTDMQKSLPATLQMIEDHLSKKFPVGSSQYMAALAAISGGTKQMQGMLDLTGSHLTVFEGNVSAISDAVKKGGANIQGWGDVQKDFNFKIDQAKASLEVLGITIGTKLLPIIGPLISNVATAVGSFTAWLNSGHAAADALSLTGSHAQIALPILAGLAALVIGIIVPAFWAWAAAMIANPIGLIIVGIALAIAGLTAGFVALYQNVSGFRGFIDGLVSGFKQVTGFIGANFIPAMQQIGAFLQANVLPILQQIGNFLASTFAPVWQQLVQLWQGQLMPLFAQLWSALQQLAPVFQQMLPVLEGIGIVVGGVLVMAFASLIGIVSGLAKGISYLVEGLARTVGGMVQMFTGVVQVVGGVVQFIVDLCTGKFNKLGGDLKGIGQGFINIFLGIWNSIAGIFQGAWGLVSGFIGGFVQGIVGFFQGLYNDLVGHSIVPDMINGIVNFFMQLPGRAGSAVSALVSSVMGKFGSLLGSGLAWAGNFVSGLFGVLGRLAGQAGSAIQTAVNKIMSVLASALGAAAQAGAKIVESIAQGILGSIGSALGNAMSSVGSFISSHLPHSPAKVGPLRDLVLQGSLIPDQIAQGMMSNKSVLQTSMNMMLAPVATSSSNLLATSSSSTPQSTAPSGTNGNNNANQPINLYIDGQLFARVMTDHLGNAMLSSIRSIGHPVGGL
jgi:TP901 family phage tail tape measure protein